MKARLEFLTPSPIYKNPQILVFTLWKAKNPGHRCDFNVASVPVTSSWMLQEFFGNAFDTLSKQSELYVYSPRSIIPLTSGSFGGDMNCQLSKLKASSFVNPLNASFISLCPDGTYFDLPLGATKQLVYIWFITYESLSSSVRGFGWRTIPSSALMTYGSPLPLKSTESNSPVKRLLILLIFSRSFGLLTG